MVFTRPEDRNHVTHCASQVIVEIPYLLVQAVLFVVITYPMIGYYWSAYKIFWYLYTLFCTLLYYNYFGMLLVSLTPNLMLAEILSSAFYLNFSLFAGFLIPKPVRMVSFIKGKPENGLLMHLSLLFPEDSELVDLDLLSVPNILVAQGNPHISVWRRGGENHGVERN